jgi:hypothetical protein
MNSATCKSGLSKYDSDTPNFNSIYYLFPLYKCYTIEVFHEVDNLKPNILYTFFQPNILYTFFKREHRCF